MLQKQAPTLLARQVRPEKGGEVGALAASCVQLEAQIRVQPRSGRQEGKQTGAGKLSGFYGAGKLVCLCMR